MTIITYLPSSGRPLLWRKVQCYNNGPQQPHLDLNIFLQKGTEVSTTLEAKGLLVLCRTPSNLDRVDSPCIQDITCFHVNDIMRLDWSRMDLDSSDSPEPEADDT